jgi:hypothetical protein
MFITNIDKLSKNLSKYYICNKAESERLIKHGFSLLSAIYDEDKYFFMRTRKLMKFLKGGDEGAWTQY